MLLAGSVGAGAVAVGGAAAWRFAAASKRPNVLVLVWDTVRADRTAFLGYQRPTMPRVASWADRAAVFTRASSPAIWTLPSHASMFTGLPPHVHGADERWLWLDQRFVSLAEHFAAHGYATFSLAANTLLCDATNLVQGFDVRLNTFKGRLAALARAATHRKLIPGDVSNELAPGWHPPANGAHNAEWARAVFKEAAPIVVRSFGQWLNARPDPEQPFFAFLNLMEAHTPRVPSFAARVQVTAANPELVSLGLMTDAAHINLHFYSFGKHAYDERQLAAINAVYDAALVDLDNATADLFDELDRRGVFDDTIVVLTADHGENLGDHHLFNHRFALWDTLLHVPLAVWGPGVAPGTIDRPVSTLDLFANLARMAGIEPPTGISADDWFTPDGAPPITALALPLEREIQSVRDFYPDIELAKWLRSGHAIVDRDDHKLIRMSDGTRTLYDLVADPGETRPVDDPVRAAALSDQLDAWLARWPAYDAAQRGPDDRPATVRASQDDLRAQLEALGYATGADEPEPDDP